MGELIAVDSITVSPIADVHSVINFYFYSDKVISYGTSLSKGNVNDTSLSNAWHLTTSDNNTYALNYYGIDGSNTYTDEWLETETDDDIDVKNPSTLKDYLYQTTVTVYSDLTFSTTKVSKSSTFSVIADFSKKIEDLQTNNLSNIIKQDADVGVTIQAYKTNGDGTQTLESEIILGDGQINIGTTGQQTYSTFSSHYVQFGHYRLESDEDYKSNGADEEAPGLMFKFYKS